MNQHYQERSESAHATASAPATAPPADEAADPAVRGQTGASEPAGQTAGAGASDQPTASASAPATGDDRVDQALSRLAELDRLAVTEHAGVVEDVHRALQDTLAEDED